MTQATAAQPLVPRATRFQGPPPSATHWVPVLAAAAFLAHLAVVAWGPYGPHRDALLYHAMGEHLRLFAMDFPPLIALLSRALRLFGDWEPLLHVPVAGAHAAIIVLAGAFARRAGGGGGAQALAALAVATAPVFMRAGSLYQPVALDQVWWAAALWLVAEVGVKGQVSGGGAAAGVSGARIGGDARAGSEARRRWLLLGLVLGLGLLTKFTILVLGAGLLVGLLATPLRRWLLTPWPWIAAALALVIGSPSIIGQAALDWPFFGQFRDLEASQLSRVTPASFALEQLLMVGPVVVLAAAGAAGLLVGRGDAGLRAVAWTAVAAFVLMMLAGGKPYYIAPIWPPLLGIALGRVGRWVRARREAGAAAGGRAPRLQGALIGGLLWLLVAGFGALALPLGLPFLPPEPMARYAARLGATQAVTTNTGERLELPQDYADMLGWEALARTVDAVWHGLSPADRERAVILATNYGRAGAIDFFGADDLPPVLAPVGSYWFWGPGDRPGAVAVVVGAEVEELAGTYWRSVVEVTRVRRRWGVPEERDVPVVVARDPVRPLQEVWRDFRGVN